VQILVWCSTRLAAVALAAALLAGGGCAAPSGGSAPATDRVHVVASFYPFAFIAERVGGDRVTVRNLTPPGAEPHDLELTPGQIDAIQKADLVLYLSGRFQAAVEKAVSSKHSFDAQSAAGPLVGSSEEPGAVDPHFWLDPPRMIKVVDAVAGRLSSADSAHASDYRSRATALEGELNDLHRAFADGLGSCARREIVTSHAAFGYMSNRYRLRQIPITGIDPEAEPTPRHMADVVALVRRYHATTVFSETLLSPKVAQTVAREAHVSTDVLDPIEGVRGPDTYMTVMRRNLRALRRALGCT
jgi:zinc transport system substrate-binding protein